MRVGMDATPLVGARTGVGAYTYALAAALAALPDGPELLLVPFTWRGADAVDAPVSPRIRASNRRAPARVLRELWARGPLPPVEWIAGERLDVFHGTNYLLPPARHAAGVVTVHDLTYLHRPEWVTGDTLRYRDLVPRALRRAGAVCTVSETVRGELLEAYGFLDSSRVVVTPNGVAPHFFDAVAPSAARRSELGLPADYVLALGTLEPRKGLDVLLEAWRLLLDRAPDLPPLLLVGQAGWGEALRTAGLPEGAVRLYGYAAPEVVPELLAGARLLAFPSRYEGFGLPPLEALAAGTPAVVSDLPVLREVLGDAARFAPTGDAAGLADVLHDALAEPPPVDRARARGFTWESCAQATTRAYEIATG